MSAKRLSPNEVDGLLNIVGALAGATSVDLRNHIAALESELNAAHHDIERLMTACNVEANMAEQRQARIDALMLEYCPGEMTAGQLANWKRHQTPGHP